MIEENLPPVALFEEEVVTSAENCQVIPKICNNSSFSTSDYHNGAKFENYCWSQNPNEIEITILLPESVKKSRDLSVAINSKNIEIKDKIKNQTIIEGELFNKVRHTEAIWNISKNKLQISLDKYSEEMWQKLLMSETKIDEKKLDCSKKFTELPEDVKLEVEKIDKERCQEKRKQDEMNKFPLPSHNIDPSRDQLLRRAWDAEGSPFKGTPFDPSKVNFM